VGDLAATIEDCERGPGNCLSYCERVLLAELREWTLPYTLSRISWVCRAEEEGRVPSAMNTQLQCAARHCRLRSES